MIFIFYDKTNCIDLLTVGFTRELAGLTGRSGGSGCVDSENEATEITPDTDTDSQEQLQKHQQQQQQQQPLPHQLSSQSSFKRPAPVMGHRGLETRNSKRSQHHQPQHGGKKDPASSVAVHPVSIQNTSGSITPNSQPITVGALEVQNVKRAINRYGTLPKGARIGAYLESLRQTTTPGGIELSPQLPPQQQVNNVPPEPPPMLATFTPNTAGIVKTPMMIRSNSSGGVTMTNSATASLNKLQRHRTTTDGSMITFSSFRGTSGSPKRAINPSLADLEFPPPPLDLPPPAEEFEHGHEIELPPPRSFINIEPLATMQMTQSTTLTPSNDVSNTEPSVEEASSRFGVSLRKREPSTDSCSSLGSPAADTTTTTTTTVQETNGVNQKLEMKLVAEIKERADHHLKQTFKPIVNDVPKDIPNSKSSGVVVDPVSQLVSELAESMNLPKHNVDLVRKVSAGSLPPKPTMDMNNTGGGSFKAQLKKVDPKKLMTTPQKEETNSIIDFKSRLRKVENNNENDASIANESTTPTINDNGLDNNKFGSGVGGGGCSSGGSDANSGEDDKSKKSESIKNTKKNGDKCLINDQDSSSTTTVNNRTGKKALDTNKVIEIKKTDHNRHHDDDKKYADVGGGLKAAAEDDDKRKSTGSISSLKKLWEAKEGTNEQILNQQLSPKLGMKNPLNNNKTTMDEENEDHPMHNKKPAVPIKPTKLVSIYATPIQVKLPPQMVDQNNTPVVPASAPTTTTTTTPTTTQINRDGILELVSLLEGNLKIPVNSISASQWLQLSDKLNILQNSCVVFADKETMPPHSKFHFRELVTRVECQSRCLRSAGSKNVQDNEKLITEVGQSLKQILNALHR